ncbi:hypothetical protein NXV81_27620 [Bacteroides ovatus]|nr:hypothetical protein [Bacteroides ovatus]
MQLFKEANRMLDLLDRDYEVKTLFKLCKANADGDNLIIEKEKDQFVTFPLLRQQTPKRDGSPFLCLSDFIRPLSSGIPDTIGAFASSIDADMEGLYEQDPYKHLLVQTLSDRLAEAATEKMHEYVRKEAWGYAKEENLGIADLLVEKYQGIRPAVGYPSLPDQSVNFLLDELLDMKQIGISLTENRYVSARFCLRTYVFASGFRIFFCRKDWRGPTRRLYPPPGKKHRRNAQISGNESSIIIILL